IANRGAAPVSISITVKGLASLGPLDIDPNGEAITVSDQVKEILLEFTGTGTANGVAVNLKPASLAGISNIKQSVSITMPEGDPICWTQLQCGCPSVYYHRLHIRRGCR